MFRYSLIAIFFLFVCHLCSAQEENSSKIVNRFKNYFNKHQADSIYQQWNQHAKTTVSKAQLDSLLIKQLYPLGTIETSSFIKNENDLEHFKLVFSKKTLKLILRVDSNEKIETFLFQPFEESVNERDTIPSVKKEDPIEDTTGHRLADESKTMESTIDNLVDSLALQYTNDPSTCGLAIGIIHNGKAGYYYYGETTRGNKTLPDQETLFEIGSISKAFTATLLANATLTDSIHLNDPIVKYLPDSIAQNKELEKITFQNLATHTSGLPRLPDNIVPSEPLDPYKDYDRKALFSYLKSYSQINKPDSVYEYSNLGYGIIGDLLAYKKNSSYNELIEKTICDPLELENTTEFPSGDKLPKFIPTYNNKGELTPHWHFLALSGAGSLKSTIRDLLKFAESNINIPNTVLGKAIALTHKPSWLVSETQDLGLSWHINIENFQEIFWQNGGTFGSSSFLAFVPGKKVAVVVLANAAKSVDSIGFSIINNLITNR
ncbi:MULTISPECIES: serine hydrolase domain-containing protein [Olivibacter]|jgi:CubicO group peptidase (beta-lactamase class C family)|uniref:Beta-lactamase n=1 Tax=Olivibacter oleidegradans TaxID=760123 RepID=A0ABV6HRL5_9SPHI|nr:MULTISPECIES: serine hydrolase [Olivibacter]MDM8176165.1 serine hydrolase [Olivibacter sp. 47]QEL00926.1 serine hydrolase [Olivibacter sp. LS-1]